MTATITTTRGTETKLRASAWRRGLTMKELAGKMGITPGYLSQIATGGRPWSPNMRAKAAAVLGEVPGQGIVYRRNGVVNGESSYIRERARELGMSMQALADKVGVSYDHMVKVSRGRGNMGVKVQARVASALQAPARVAPEQCPSIDREAVWERMRAHGFTQNEVARQVGVSSGYLSQIMNCHRVPSPAVLKRLHWVLFRRTQAERVVPVQVRVLGWHKGERKGMVIQGAGGPRRRNGDYIVRAGGRMPDGARVYFAYRTGHDGYGRVSVTHLVRRECSAMLKKPERVAGQDPWTTSSTFYREGR